MKSRNFTVSYDELYQITKENLMKCPSPFLPNKPFSQEQLYDIFKTCNPHKITHAIVKIAKQSAIYGVYAFELLNYAKISPLANESYRHNFLTKTKSCIEKLNECEVFIIIKMQKAEEIKACSSAYQQNPALTAGFFGQNRPQPQVSQLRPSKLPLLPLPLP